MKMDFRLRIVLCYIVIPFLERFLNAIEDEIRETKTKWDDVALEGGKAFINAMRELCKQAK